MTDKERKEIFEHRADRAAWNVKLMSYTAFKCALADAERIFIESADQIKPVPSIPTHYGDGVASDQTDMVGAEDKTDTGDTDEDADKILGKVSFMQSYNGVVAYYVRHEDAIEAMYRYASIQVENVRKEMEGEIDALKWGVRMNHSDLLKCQSDLSAAKSRIAELEKENKELSNRIALMSL